MSAAWPGRHGRLLRSSPWTRAGAGFALTALALVSALVCMLDAAAIRQTSGLGARLAGAATVVVWDRGLESADAAAARAAEILAAVPGVAAVHTLDSATGNGLVAKLAGAPDGVDARLLTVEARDGARGLPARIQQAVHAANLAAHTTTRRGFGGRAVTLAVIGGALLPLAALAAFALVCAGEARREAARAGGLIEVMHLSGASDGYIAGLIRGRVDGLALACVLWGAAGALAAAAALSRVGPIRELGGLIRQDLVSPWPLVLLGAWLAGAAASWAGARALLRAMP